MSALLQSFVEYEYPVAARSAKPVLSVVREGLAYGKFLLKMAAMPFVALGWLIALPFIAFGMLSWIGVKAIAAAA